MDELLALLAEWGRCSTLESQAVGASNWNEVLRLQRCKNDLQQRISLLPPSCPNPAVQQKIEQKVRELIEQQAQLEQALILQRKAASLQQAQWQSTVGHLRKIRHAYRAEPHVRWQSYS